LAVSDDVLALVRRRGVVYQREAQVLLEKPPDVEHWDVTNALGKLEIEGLVSSKSVERQRWYFDSNKKWEMVEDLARQKIELVKYYSRYEYGFVSQPQGVRYDDYTEYFVEDALKTAGCVVFAKSTNYFNGLSYFPQGVAPGRPPDLDFTAGAPSGKLFLGVSVKNQLDYPKQEDVEQMIEMCSELGLRPLMVARMLSGVQVKRVHGAGGYTVIYKRWLLKPDMPREVFDKISDAGKGKSVLDLPLSIYRRTPDFLLLAMKRAVVALGGYSGNV
jgi:hypothetical protein